MIAKGRRAGLIRDRLSLLAIVSGASLAAQARVNGALRTRLGSAVVVALVSFSVGLLALLAAALATRRVRAFRALRHGTRWWWWLGGLAGALLVSSSAAAVPSVGVALTAVAIVAGATAGGLVVDMVGLSPRGRAHLTPYRVAGAVLAVAGLLVGAVGRHGTVRPGLLLVVGLAGFASAGQQAANGWLRETSGDAVVAATVSFAVGTLALLVVCGALATSGHLPHLRWPGGVGLYAGGLGGASYIALAAYAVGRLGVLRLTLGTVAGQLVAGVALDALAPAGSSHLTLPAVLAALCTLAAVVAAATGE